MKTKWYTLCKHKTIIHWTCFFFPGGLPRGFFETAHPSTVRVSFLFMSDTLIIGDVKFAWNMGLGGGNDVVFCTGKTVAEDTTNKK